MCAIKDKDRDENFIGYGTIWKPVATIGILGIRSTINIFGDTFRDARSQNVFKSNNFFLSCLLFQWLLRQQRSESEIEVKKRRLNELKKSEKELCVVWNLCKFAFKVIKLIQVFFSFLFCAMFVLAYTQFCF